MDIAARQRKRLGAAAGARCEDVDRMAIWRFDLDCWVVLHLRGHA
jgi:hypothetical protein